MVLAITDDHHALADVVASFAAAQDLKRAARLVLDRTADTTATDWKQICGLGWAGLHLPEEYGGSGYGLAELAVVVDGLGAAAAGGPLLPATIGSAVVAAVGDPETKAHLLPGAVDGSVVIAFVPSGSLVVDEDGLVRGEPGPVLGGAWATHLLLRRDADLLLVDTQHDAVAARPGTPLDPAAGVSGFGVSGAPAQLLGSSARTAIAVSRTLIAAEASGGAGATLRMALAYSKVREQFGRTIGSFQAIKHKLADMLVDSERATAVAWDAARAASQRDGQSEQAAAVASAVALDAYQRNAQVNIQIHGGIGFTWEHDAHLYLRRAVSLAALFGRRGETHDEIADHATSGIRRIYAVDLPAEADAYRADARAFLSRYNAAPGPDRRGLIARSGYLVPHWTRPWGRGAGAVEQLVIEEELAEIEVPNLGIGGWVTLTLTQHATADQLARWIWPSLLGELVWCQLFSEPNAGSDAAAVQTRGVRVEGGWRVTGQKVWTSGAQDCNRGLATIRTDAAAPKHKGITAVVVDLTAPGVEIRPLREITGEALFNEVFLDNVFVPDADVVGEVNAGWLVARATLGNERISIGARSESVAPASALIALLGRYAPDDAGLRREFGRLVADEQTIQLINLRQITRAVEGDDPGAEGSITKLLTSELAQRSTELALQIIGSAAADGTEPSMMHDFLLSRALTIAGGTSEIARNVIAERLLGLPREPRGGDAHG